MFLVSKLAQFDPIEPKTPSTKAVPLITNITGSHSRPSLDHLLL